MKAVSHLTGVRPELLRRWEKRYHLFKPQRAGNRYREFDDEDLQLLLYIRQQIDQGRSIGELAAEGREAILRRLAPAPASPVQQSYRGLIDELLGYIQQLDKARLEARLAECVAHSTFTTMLHMVFVPLMHRLGDLWVAGEVAIASERFATTILKQRLLTMLQTTAPGAGSPLLLCASPAGEFHELGLLIFAYAMQQDGWQVCYLGSDLPLHELRWSCRQLHPALVALSLTHVIAPTRFLEVVQEIDASIAPTYPTFVGGQAIETYQHLLHPGHVWCFDTLQAALSCARQSLSRLAPREIAAPTLGKITASR
jgi:DNA-binding transcriptional MerR regulator